MMSGGNPDNWVLKVTLLLTSSLIVMVTGVIPPALPLIEAHFAGVSDVTLLTSLVLTLPCLVIAVTAPIMGYAVDRVGRKPVLTISTLAFGVSGATGYLAPTLPLLLITRAALGVAVAGLVTSVTTLTADYYTGAARSRFMGLQGAVMGAGGAVALILGGVLADVGWRLPFLVYSFAIVVLPLILLVLCEPLADERCGERIYPVAGPAQCVAESMHTPGGSHLPAAGVSSAPPRLVLVVYAMVFGTQLLFTFIPVQLPFHLLRMTAATASQTGLAISVTSVSYAVAALAYGRVGRRLEHPRVLTIGFSLMGVGFLLIWVAGGWPLILLGLLLAGAGQGLLIPDLSVWLSDETVAQLRGRVLGGLATALFLGVFISPFVGQPVNAAIGFEGVSAGAGALLLATAAGVWVRRVRVLAVSGSLPKEREKRHRAPGEGLGERRVQRTPHCPGPAGGTGSAPMQRLWLRSPPGGLPRGPQRADKSR